MAEQLPLFDLPPPMQKIVNVAQVTHRSPLRYAGGKTWLVPRTRRWIQSLSQRPAECVEPFCGGATIGLSLAFDGLVEHVTLVELDEQVGAIWQTIIEDEGGGEWLARQIEAFDLILANVDELLAHPPGNTRELALQTVVRNRINRGGILAPGAGRIKEGESGKGLKSRWYADTLAKRIRDIVSIRERLTFIQGDGLAVLQHHAHQPDAVFFIDPPYTAGGKQAGNRLYTVWELDHPTLFATVAGLAGDFLMTYDNDPAVQALADAHNFDTLPVAMKNTHHAEMTELLIGRDLGWAVIQPKNPLSQAT